MGKQANRILAFLGLVLALAACRSVAQPTERTRVYELRVQDAELTGSTAEALERRLADRDEVLDVRAAGMGRIEVCVRGAVSTSPAPPFLVAALEPGRFEVLRVATEDDFAALGRSLDGERGAIFAQWTDLGTDPGTDLGTDLAASLRGGNGESLGRLAELNDRLGPDAPFAWGLRLRDGIDDVAAEDFVALARPERPDWQFDNRALAEVTRGSDSYGFPALHVRLTEPAGERMLTFTREIVGQHLAIVVDAGILTLATVESAFGARFQAGGRLPEATVDELARLLQSEPLPSRLSLVETVR